MEYRFKRIDSPVGLLTLAAKGDKLTAILWECEIDGRVKLGEMIEDPAFPVLLKTEQQLNEYFAGKAKRPRLAQIESKKNTFYPMKSFEEGLQSIK